MQRNTPSRGTARPKALQCYVCGREYGTTSLPIHIKACIRKFEQEQQQKPPHQRRTLPQPPAMMDTVLEQAKTGGVTMQQMHSYNQQANDDYNNKMLVPCPNCKRTFKEDSLKVHLRSCKTPSHRPTNSNQGIQTRQTNRPFKKKEESNGSFIGTQQEIPSVKRIPSARPSAQSTRPQPPPSRPQQQPPSRPQQHPPTRHQQQNVRRPPPTQPAFNPGLDEYEPQDLVECRVCHRKFNSDRIQKHQKICQSHTNKDDKRMKKIEMKARQKEMQQKKQERNDAKYQQKLGKGVPKWKQQHQELVESMKYMRRIKAAEAKGIDIRQVAPPPQNDSHNQGLIQCPHCSRRFNESILLIKIKEAAERHIPKCATTINKAKPPSKVNRFEKKIPATTTTKQTPATTTTKQTPATSTIRQTPSTTTRQTMQPPHVSRAGGPRYR